MRSMRKFNEVKHKEFDDKKNKLKTKRGNYKSEKKSMYDLHR